MKHGKQINKALRILLCLLVVSSMTLSSLSPALAKMAGLSAAGDSLPDNVVRTGELSAQPEDEIPEKDQPSASGGAIDLPQTVQPMKAPLTAPAINRDGDSFTYTVEKEDGSTDYTLICSERDDGTLLVDFGDISEGADIVIPDTIEGMTVTAIRPVTGDAAAKIGSLKCGESVRDIEGNFLPYGETESKYVKTDLGVDLYSDSTVQVPKTAQLLSAIPDFISDNYEDGAYYLGKCLVRVDPGFEGDLIVDEGTVCVLASAAEGCDKLGAVILPDSVEYIGVRAFANSSITSINLPKGLDERSSQVEAEYEEHKFSNIGEAIEWLSFYGCDKLESVTIEAEQIYDVGYMAFFKCSALKEFDMTRVGYVQSLSFAGAFAEGYELDLSATQDNNLDRYYVSEEGYCYSRNFTWGVFADSGISSVKFGENSFQYIPFEAFRSCDNLTDVTFTDGQLSVGTRAFEKCAGLSADVLAESKVRNLKHRSFAQCGFTEITVPETLLFADGGVFAENPQLEVLNWKSSDYFLKASDKPSWYEYSGERPTDPQPYELINGAGTTGTLFAVLDEGMSGASGTGSYANMSSWFTSFEKSDTYTQITTLNLYALPEPGDEPYLGNFFSMQPALEEVNVMFECADIPAYAFHDCGNLKSFTLSSPDSLRTVGDNAFAVCGFEELVMMDGVEYGSKVFMRNTSLETLVIEEGVKTIPYLMFAECPKISEVSVPESLETLGWASFKDSGDHMKFYVPKACTLIEDDAFGYETSGGQFERVELIIMDDPVIETFHPDSGLTGGKNTYALDNFLVFRVWTNSGDNFNAYMSAANYRPSDIRQVPSVSVKVRSTEEQITLGEEPDKTKVSVELDGEALSQDDFEIEFDSTDRTLGERLVKVTINGVDAQSVLTSYEISAIDFYGDEKTGPVYEVSPASELGYKIEVVEAEYNFTKGDGATWTKRVDTGDLEFTVKRAENDELSFERFTGLQIDSKELSEEYYTAEAGSVNIALSEEWLENAFIGEHSLTVLFEDGHAETEFTIDALPPDTLEHAEDNDGDELNVTYDSTKHGIRINLFDYHIDADWWQYGDRWANQAGQWSYGGINDVSNLKFYGHGGPEVMHGNSNEYTGRSTARQGIVLDRLEPDPDAEDPSKAAKYPVMTEFGQQNLAILFKPENVEGQKTVYKNVTHLFQKDGQGNYWFDSDRNYAYYDPEQGDGGSFVLYDGTFQVNLTNPENQVTEDKFNVGYYPFDDWDESKQNVAPTDDLRDQGIEGYDHQHGLTMDCNFYIPESGKIDGEDLIFRFSGDDDVWVFVDDVLVMDMGGIHKPVSGEINFTTGEVSVEDVVVLQPWDGQYPPVDTPQTIGSYATLDEIFDGEWSGSGTAKPIPLKAAPKAGEDEVNPGKGWHQLRFFYLERGGCYSNMSLMTNLWKATGDQE
ncbi:MAG: leucine-rich repeat protein, partial [Firmicutes bacterium]|nr:leucine-rich repeat protein [Bacillota bacterium]